MERIKQALELARQERERHLVSPAAPLHVSGPGHGEAKRTPYSGQQRPVGRDGHVGIRYTRTRIVEPTPRSLRRNHLLAKETGEPIVSVFKLLRTRVLQAMRNHQWQTLAITSPGATEGKTVTAVNLAISLAREVNHTVLLVDLDLRSPGVHRCFGHEPEYGIVDHLVRDVPLEDVLFNPGMPRLVVAPGRQGVKDSSELLSSPRMRRLVDQLKRRYASRLILFDLPPVVATDDALAFSPFVDCALIVAEEGKTDRGALRQTLNDLSSVTVLGTVLNKSSESRPIYDGP